MNPHNLNPTPRDVLAGLLPAAIFWSVFSFFICQFLVVQLVGLHFSVSEDSARIFWAFYRDNTHPAHMAMIGFVELFIGFMCFEYLRRRGVEDCVLQAGRFSMLSIYIAAFATLVIPGLIFEAFKIAFSFINQEMPKLNEHENSGIFPAHQLLGLFIVVIVIAPVIEEFLFRGFLITSMEARGWPSVVIVIASAGAFTLLHVGYTGFGLLFIFMLGVMLGMIRLWSGGLILPIAAHAAFNMKSFLFSYFNALG